VAELITIIIVDFITKMDRDCICNAAPSSDGKSRIFMAPA